tara:strand:- start:185 stop:442 length:258 start_codon:yes stop_codon:yes gene_type:complete
MGNKIILVMIFVSLTLLYIIMDQKKEETITQIENFYCQRLTELVDLKMFDEAHAVYEEFAVDVDNPVDWLFLLEDAFIDIEESNK